MRKKILVLIALIMFFDVLIPKQSHALVVSKVVSQAAKQTAKEVVKDITIDMSMNMVMNYKYVPKDQRKPKDGFEIVCLPKDKKTDGDCAAPIQIKKSITKSEIAPVIETQLEKKISGGVTATKWGKFLDWFLPIFATGLGVAVIDYAMDGDVIGLFDEIAYDTLLELGFLQPLEKGTDTGTDGGFVRPSISYEMPPNATTNDWKVLQLDEVVNLNGLFDCGGVNDCIKFEAVYGSVSKTPTLRVLPRNNGTLTVSSENLNQVSDDFGFTLSSNSLHLKKFATTKYGNDAETIATYRINPAVYTTPSNYIQAKTGSGASTTLVRPELFMFSMLNLLRFASEPVEINGVSPEPLLFTYSGSSDETTVPKFDEAQLQPTKNPGSVATVVAPGAIPFTEINTGEVLYPFLKPDGTVGFKTKTGTEVLDPDNNVGVGSPTIIENPDGTKTVVKQPTFENQNPSPEEDGKIPTKGDEITEGDFEGLSCARLKKPDFKPLSNAFTTSFPFSIPWDLWRLVEAVFGNMGSEKPVVDLSFIAEGVKLEIPDYFDSWTKFAKSITLIAFDIGLIYMFYRFMKGGAD